jgi:hypothetical protein
MTATSCKLLMFYPAGCCFSFRYILHDLQIRTVSFIYGFLRSAEDYGEDQLTIEWQVFPNPRVRTDTRCSFAFRGSTITNFVLFGTKPPCLLYILSSAASVLTGVSLPTPFRDPETCAFGTLVWRAADFQYRLVA